MKNSTSLHSVLCVLIFLAAHLPATAEAQSFRHYIPLESKDGKTIQVEIIYFTSSTVMARRADGLMFEMPPQRLTPATLQRILAYPAAKASAEAEAAKLYPPFVGSGLPVRPSVVGTTDEERKFAELWKEKAVTMTGDGLVALMRSDDAGGYLPHIKAGLSPWIVFLSNDINSMKGPPNNCIRGSIVDVSLGIGDLVEGGQACSLGLPKCNPAWGIRFGPWAGDSASGITPPSKAIIIANVGLTTEVPLDSKLGELTLVSESIATGFSVPHLTIISPIIIETAPRPDRETLLSFFAYVVFEGALEKQGDESQRRGRNLAVGAINYFRGFAKALDGETQGLANSLLEHEAFKEAAQLLETGERIDRRAK